MFLCEFIGLSYVLNSVILKRRRRFWQSRLSLYYQWFVSFTSAAVGLFVGFKELMLSGQSI